MAETKNSRILRTIPLLIVAFFAGTTNAKYGGGSGEPNDPYLIYTAEQMISISQNQGDWDKHFRLTADLDLTGMYLSNYSPIGISQGSGDDYMEIPFQGVFDGNDHSIRGFTPSIGYNVGLFGIVDGGAHIKNLTMIDPNVVGFQRVGALVAQLKQATVTRCIVQGGKVSGPEFVEFPGLYIGGLIGSNLGGTVADCNTTCDIPAGTYSVGGLVGENLGAIRDCSATGTVGKVKTPMMAGGLVGWNKGSIAGCRATGNVFGKDHETGGLVGANEGTITHCYATGRVIGKYWVGGLSGGNDYVNPGSISNSYATGSVTGEKGVGGLVGHNPGTISSCYATGPVSGLEDVGGLIGRNRSSTGETAGTVIACFWNQDTSGQALSDGGTGLTTAQMQDPNTYLDAGWDFVDETENGTEDIWKIVEGKTYPLLSWQKYGGGTGEPNNPYLIFTAEHLNDLGAESNDYDKHFKLMADIDLSGYSYDRAVIAPDVNDVKYWEFNGISFNGAFDGNGYVVSNLTITGKSYLGLFGQVGPEGQVKGLGVEEVNITGSYTAIGGLVGDKLGNIAASYSTGTVTGYNRVGGLVGWNKYGDISASYSTCAASATFSGNQCVGGLVGITTGSITACYSSGDVSGERKVGGLVGWNYQSKITNSYSTGAVSGDSDVGGLVGIIDQEGDMVTGCFWDVETSGQSSSAGGTGLTTAEMQTASTFIEAGWDFVDETKNGTEDIWWIDEGKDYPRLWWELNDEN